MTPKEDQRAQREEELRRQLAAIELPAPDDPLAERKWKTLATALLPVYRDAGAGLINLEPTQRQILQSIMDRAFGKAGIKKDATAESGGIVVLPMTGEAAKSRVCPTCLAHHLSGHA